MYQATVTDREQHKQTNQQTGYADLAARRSEAQAALEGLRGTPSPDALAAARRACQALRAQMIDVEEKYHAYRAMPHEADAGEVGAAAALAFDEDGS